MEWLWVLLILFVFIPLGIILGGLLIDFIVNIPRIKKGREIKKLIKENGPITRAFVKYYYPCIIDDYDAKLGDHLYKEYYYEKDDIFQRHQCSKDICVEKINLDFNPLTKNCSLTFNNGITGYMTSYEWKYTCFSDVRYIAIEFKNKKKVVLYDSKRTRTMAVS